MAENRILMIVDDSKVSRMMIKAIIKEHYPEFEILEAANGDEALSCIQSHRVELAITDFNMPGMDGLKLAEILKEKIPTIKICLLTANIQESNQRRAQEVGVNFTKKPITEDKIISIIKSMT